MPDRPWKDEYTLLCEKCGYVIEGLDTQGNCPECGKPIAESLPERRVGTPWQQNPSFGSLVRTWWMTLRHPLRTLDVMCFDDQIAHGLLPRTIFVFVIWSSILASLPHLMAPMSWDLILGVGIVLVFNLMIWSTVALLVYLLVGIEALGLQIISRTKQTRITSTVAWTAVAHGAIAWGVSYIIWLAAWIWTSGLPEQTESPHQFIYRLNHIMVPSLLIGLLIGLVLFETFAYLGLRRLKFANRPRPNDA